jgi:hypothetical protein
MENTMENPWIDSLFGNAEKIRKSVSRLRRLADAADLLGNEKLSDQLHSEASALETSVEEILDSHAEKQREDLNRGISTFSSVARMATSVLTPKNNV